MLIQLKSLFVALLALNLSAILFVMFKGKRPAHLQTLQATQQLENPYRFEDPILAYQILKKIDVFEPVDDIFYDNLLTVGNRYNVPFLSLINDENYCDKHRAYFVDHPEFIFRELNFIMDYPRSYLVRDKVGRVIGNDVQANISAGIPGKYNTSYLFNIRPNVNSFFINGGMHIYQHIEKSFACISQTYNHIPGHGSLNRKDKVAESIVAYAEKYKDKPQCFSFDRFFPKTWILYYEEPCKAFFEHFKSDEYKQLKKDRRIVYIRKKGFGAHRAEGVQPVNEEEELQLRKLYADGAHCGKQKLNYIIQTFVHNPLLLDEHKFDFRIYMLVASTNPLILFYHDGFLRMSLHKYDVHSDDKGVLLTNTELSKKIFDDLANGGTWMGMNETEVRDYQMWTFDRLHKYLIDHNVVSDPNWLDNHLRLQFKKAMVHLLRMSEYSFLKRSSIYELFGADFMLDENLNLWFLECNTSPVLKGTSTEKERFLVKMLRDHFEIVFGLLRSRMKRVILLVNRLTNEFKDSNQPWEALLDKDLDNLRRHYKTITKNSFEPEFMPSSGNGFSKIIDENLEGTDRYAGLIAQECL